MPWLLERASRRRAAALALALAAALLAVAAADAPAQAPPGFQIDLVGPRADVHVECFKSGEPLTCALYGAPQRVDGTCDFGGAVPTVVLPPDGPAEHGLICVDEGFHDWDLLRIGRSWRSAPFRCTSLVGVVRGRARGRLECFGGAATGFAVTGSGGVDLSLARRPVRRPAFCGSIAFTPRTEDGAGDIVGFRTGCRTARRVARASRAHGVDEQPRRYRAHGYSCRGRLRDRGLPTVAWYCVRGRAVVSFVRS